jgi:tyramine---L-glutamate ligase
MTGMTEKEALVLGKSVGMNNKAMKKTLLLLEYVTGGGLYESTYESTSAHAAGSLVSLMHEGELMINALLGDCTQVLAASSITVMRDARLPVLAQVSCVSVSTNFQAVWHEQLSLHEAVWIVAPETEGVLLQLVSEAAAAGLQVFNASTEAIALCTSKIRTSQHLIAQGISAVPCYPLDKLNTQELHPTWAEQVIVVKPDDGAGCMNTKRYECLSSMRVSVQGIAQPYVHGEAMSLSVWCEGETAYLLSVNEQLVYCDEKGDFHFSGCMVNVAHEQIKRLSSLSQAVLDAIPGLYACIGIDLIHTPDNEWIVMEINPRMTTSFAALREARGINLAELAFAKLHTTGLPTGKTIEIRV